MRVKTTTYYVDLGTLEDIDREAQSPPVDSRLAKREGGGGLRFIMFLSIRLCLMSRPSFAGVRSFLFHLLELGSLRPFAPILRDRPRVPVRRTPRTNQKNTEATRARGGAVKGGVSFRFSSFFLNCLPFAFFVLASYRFSWFSFSYLCHIMLVFLALDCFFPFVAPPTTALGDVI